MTQAAVQSGHTTPTGRAASSGTAANQRSWFLSASLVSAAVAAGHLPLLGNFFRDLGNRDQYGFYPLLLIAAAVLAGIRLGGVPAERVRRGSWAIAAPLLLLSLAILACGDAFYMRWFAAPAAWLTLAAVVWRLGGPAVARALLPVGILLLVIVPPPFHLDEMLTRRLQRVAVSKSSALLDLLGVPHFMTGTVIEIPGHRLMVEEACSGINSLISVVAFTLLYGFLKCRSAFGLCWLLLAAVWFVLCANVGRITLGGYVLAKYNVNLLTQTVHEWTGLALFAVSLCLVLSFDQLVLLVSDRFRAGRDADAAEEGDRSAAADTDTDAADVSATTPVAQPGAAWWAFAIAFAAAGVIGQQRLKDCWPVSHMPSSLTLSPPAQVGPWTRVSDAQASERTENFAKYSQRWQYRRTDGVMAEVAIAYPFTTGWHDPAVCYTAAGWNVTGGSSHDEPAPGGASLPSRPYFVRHLQRLGGTLGYDLFASFDEAGQWLSPPVEQAPDGSLAYRLWLSKRAASLSSRHEVQTLLVSTGPIQPQDQRDAETLFLAARQSLAEQALGQLDGRAAGKGRRDDRKRGSGQRPGLLTRRPGQGNDPSPPPERPGLPCGRAGRAHAAGDGPSLRRRARARPDLPIRARGRRRDGERRLRHRARLLRAPGARGER